MELTKEGQAALEIILKAAGDNHIDVGGGKIRRTSSRFCLGVEHGDYNGTELFGVGTDRIALELIENACLHATKTSGQ